MCVDRMELTRTSPVDHTNCGSSLGSNVIVLTHSAGPPAYVSHADISIPRT